MPLARIAPPVLLGIALLSGAAEAQPPSPSRSRGALLYDTHCVTCHTEQIHWRARRRATEWGSLREQVRQWQGNAGLGWSPEDIDAVTRHLNATIYNFPSPQVLGAR